jgi:hypothetical protein
MNLKRSVRKSTRIAVSCGGAVDIMPIVMSGSLNKPVAASSGKK